MPRRRPAPPCRSSDYCHGTAIPPAQRFILTPAVVAMNKLHFSFAAAGRAVDPAGLPRPRRLARNPPLDSSSPPTCRCPGSWRGWPPSGRRCSTSCRTMAVSAASSGPQVTVLASGGWRHSVLSLREGAGGALPPCVSESISTSGSGSTGRTSSSRMGAGT